MARKRKWKPEIARWMNDTILLLSSAKRNYDIGQYDQAERELRAADVQIHQTLIEIHMCETCNRYDCNCGS